jgi:superfamily I DNA/RNA helicase
MALSGLGKKAADQFKNWCFQNRFSLRDGLGRIRRFPIPGMTDGKQQQLYEFSVLVSRLQTDFIGLTIVDKLQLLTTKTKLSGMLNKDPFIRDAYSRLLDYAAQFDGSAPDFLAALALHTDTDAYLAEAEKVPLMTMHASKGLEFPIVFIAGCEESLIPHRKPDREDYDIQEERRLFYVAMTRAMERLYLTRAKKRRIYGRQFDRHLSPFVDDIENQLKIDESPRLEEKKEKEHRPVQLKLF